MRDDKDRSQILAGVVNASLHSQRLYMSLFGCTLTFLYNQDVLSEDGILDWEDSLLATQMTAESKALLDSAQELLSMLKESSSEEEESDDE